MMTIALTALFGWDIFLRIRIGIDLTIITFSVHDFPRYHKLYAFKVDEN